MNQPSLRLQRFIARMPGLISFLRQHLEADSCIETSRIVNTLLTKWRIPSQIVPVETHIHNAAFVRLSDARDAAGLFDPANGAHFVVMGAPGPPEPGRWAGHLVVLAEGLLIDCTIDQANRPQHGIVLQSPWIQHLPPGFLRSRAGTTTLGPGGIEVEYRPRPENLSYRQTPGWRAAPRLVDDAWVALRTAAVAQVIPAPLEDDRRAAHPLARPRRPE